MSLINAPTEYQESVTFHQWLQVRRIRHTHIPNENGRNSAIRGAMNKRMGVSKGFPDFLVFVDGKCLAIELKRRSGGSVSPEQREWLKVLAAHGFECGIARGASEAIEFVSKYIRKETVEI